MLMLTKFKEMLTLSTLDPLLRCLSFTLARVAILVFTLLQSTAPGSDDDEKDLCRPKNTPVRTPKDAE